MLARPEVFGLQLERVQIQDLLANAHLKWEISFWQPAPHSRHFIKQIIYSFLPGWMITRNLFDLCHLELSSNLLQQQHLNQTGMDFTWIVTLAELAFNWSRSSSDTAVDWSFWVRAMNRSAVKCIYMIQLIWLYVEDRRLVLSQLIFFGVLMSLFPWQSSFFLPINILKCNYFEVEATVSICL